jgi:hypothetical protein
LPGSAIRNPTVVRNPRDRRSQFRGHQDNPAPVPSHDGLTQAPDDGQRTGRLRIRKHHRKLLAALAMQNIADAQLPLPEREQATQHRIADAVTKAVIDIPDGVDIGEHPIRVSPGQSGRDSTAKAPSNWTLTGRCGVGFRDCALIRRTICSCPITTTVRGYS